MESIHAYQTLLKNNERNEHWLDCLHPDYLGDTSIDREMIVTLDAFRGLYAKDYI